MVSRVSASMPETIRQWSEAVDFVAGVTACLGIADFKIPPHFKPDAFSRWGCKLSVTLDKWCFIDHDGTLVRFLPRVWLVPSTGSGSGVLSFTWVGTATI